MEKNARKGSRRLARAFMVGLADGFSSPALPFAGREKILASRKFNHEIDTLWRDVGKIIKSSAEEYRRRKVRP